MEAIIKTLEGGDYHYDTAGGLPGGGRGAPRPPPGSRGGGAGRGDVITLLQAAGAPPSSVSRKRSILKIWCMEQKVFVLTQLVDI